MSECKGEKNLNSARMRARPTIEELQKLLEREPDYPVEITPAGEVMAKGLRLQLEHAINRVSAENGSNTPDFILADYLVSCLAAFDRAVCQRERWYNRMPVPGTEPQQQANPLASSAETGQPK